MYGGRLSQLIADPPLPGTAGYRGEGSCCEQCPLKRENLELRQERGYWRKQHQRAVERERELEAEIERLKARIRYLEHELYGRKNEQGTGGSERNGDGAADRPRAASRPRGQQRGAPGHPRRSYEHLPVQEQVVELPPEQRRCPSCGLELAPFPGTEDSETIEIEVRAYRRRIKRRRYRPSCQCGQVPGIVTAPAPAKLIAKGKLGISLWASLVVEKYLYQRPIARQLESLKSYELDLAPGTVGDGLKRLAELFKPVEAAIQYQSRQELWWIGDETRWLVFELPAGKENHRWWLWVWVSPTTVVYRLDPSRSAEVVKAHLGPVEQGILLVDRYAAYKKFAREKNENQEKPRFILAFCWTHQRRDFLTVARKWPQLEDWGLEWVQQIGGIFHLNHLRVAYPRDSEEFEHFDRELRAALGQMEQRREQQQGQPGLDAECLGALESLKEHWGGLQVFLEHPEIPMDTSEAERALRGPALGRKNYYGAVTIESAQFTARMFTILQTIVKGQLNPRQWTEEYLQACAENGGQAPQDLSRFLPWTMSDAERQRLSRVRIRGDPVPSGAG